MPEVTLAEITTTQRVIARLIEVSINELNSKYHDKQLVKSELRALYGTQTILDSCSDYLVEPDLLTKDKNRSSNNA